MVVEVGLAPTVFPNGGGFTGRCLRCSTSLNQKYVVPKSVWWNHEFEYKMVRKTGLEPVRPKAALYKNAWLTNYRTCGCQKAEGLFIWVIISKYACDQFK